ncbi:hypothetical protein HPHPP2B_0073 [Helicobacter pylori Hp P-2b]|uniref:Uncharacterized protein n=1 Tax=Helicobacter pylori Hp P-2 TaxID=992073 RepID=J0PL78_HELPX|nr:hypothetical protein HPHPP2_0072 [Helicobacter pylori Hp P-2]EJC57301.1 hypothetical protein HPHPP2B_0073 [Helicobacter pylori Hp P-2b]
MAFCFGYYNILKDSLMTKSYRHKEGFYVTIPKIIIIK